jgi:hypothetical protein
MPKIMVSLPQRTRRASACAAGHSVFFIKIFGLLETGYYQHCFMDSLALLFKSTEYLNFRHFRQFRQFRHFSAF